ncbi:NUDIX domain-containing protein [Nocardia sp. NPDC005978]|uniref:NUDIX hydrolase n=1 Tax=Nocardia sp. NPDC005978 TaxID=3156725 RepID=UPI00339E1666
MATIEYYNDPDAPAPNSIVAAATAFVRDARDRVLLTQRADNGLWMLPGGGQEFGEYIAATAVRETRAETGIDIYITGLVGIYTNPNHVLSYPDGEVRQQFSICFRAEPRGGALPAAPGSPRVSWVSHADLNGLAMHPSTRLRIKHGYARLAEPYIG